MTKRCALLTTDDLDDFFVYDYMTIEPLGKFGWQAEEVSWKDSKVNWNDFDVVIIRSTWDYQNSPDAFLRCLETIDQSSAQLENSLELVKWNINKAYLRDLAAKSVKIVPTLWFQTFDEVKVAESFSHFNSDEIVIKPLVSANADHTYRLTRQTMQQQIDVLKSTFSTREFMLQPFVEAIVSEGEYSLFYFAGELSHSIVKRPKEADFRVQEEHGGQLALVDPEPELVALAEFTYRALPEDPLFARLDFIRTEQGFAVMEIELIEPSLYFNMDSGSAQRFADGFVRRFGQA